jgi:hypothetical protein
LVQELHEAGSKDAEAYAFCSVIPEVADDQGLTEAESNEWKEKPSRDLAGKRATYPEPSKKP